MAQRLWVDGFFQARAHSGLLASVTRRLRIDGLITVVPTVARKQPGTFSAAGLPLGWTEVIGLALLRRAILRPCKLLVIGA
jgi:hypothetical protein